MTVRCHACGRVVDTERVAVRDVCPRCSAWLHCCLNCTFHERGRHNDCREPQAAPVPDKTAGNFCDYFHPKPPESGASDDTRAARDALDRLFRKPK